MKVIQESPSQLILESKVIFGLLGATTYVFDKAKGKLEISGKGLFGSKPADFALTEFTGVALHQQSMTSAEQREASQRTYRIELLRQTGANYPLTTAYSSGKAAKEQIVEKIRKVLAA